MRAQHGCCISTEGGGYEGSQLVKCQYPFGGRARQQAICQLCLSEQHSAKRCPQCVVSVGSALAYLVPNPNQFLLYQAAVPTQRAGGITPFQTAACQPEICRLFYAKGGNFWQDPTLLLHAHFCSLQPWGSQCPSRAVEMALINQTPSLVAAKHSSSQSAFEPSCYIYQTKY